MLEYDAPGFANVKQGIALLEKYATDHPGDPFASLMWQTAGDSYFMPLGDEKNSLRCYEVVDRLGWTDQGNQGPWYWRAARLADRLGENAIAIKYYTKIITETPNSGKGYAAVLALRKLGAPVPKSPLFDDPSPAAPEAAR